MEINYFVDKGESVYPLFITKGHTHNGNHPGIVFITIIALILLTFMAVQSSPLLS